MSWIKREGSSRKVKVLKIRHPRALGGHDYSYGVLIESRGTFGSDFSGWIIFFDVCGDYSGFSGTEHAYIESTIKLHLKNEATQLREKDMRKDTLKKYLLKASTEREISPNSNEHKKRKDILNEARGMIVELLVYYLQTQIKGQDVRWGVEKADDGDIDVLIDKEDSVKLIECKLDPSEDNFEDEIEKIKKKADECRSPKEKLIEFWFWREPHPNIVKKLESKKIEYHVLSKELNLPNFQKKIEKLNLILNPQREKIQSLDHLQ